LLKRRIIISLIVITLIIGVFTNNFFITSIVKFTNTVSANPGDINETWHNTSLLTVEVLAPAPWIMWYDFQNITNVSKLNEQIDVNNQHKFCINISQNSSWEDVDYINITAWYDNGSDAGSYYNQTSGGNINMFLQYVNTTGTGTFSMRWPDDEVTWISGSEYVHNDSVHNLTFNFTPLYQVRHAPGDGSWSTAYNTTDDAYSWNFKIEVNTSNQKSAYKEDEYGIYRYAEINSAGNPTMSGYPATTATAAAITVVSRANANFSLSVELNSTLDGPGSHTLANTTVGVLGGDLAETNFDGTGPLYIYGGAASYRIHDVDTYERSTSVTYHCDIPFGTFSGQYTSLVYYHLKLDTT
jgi:hypothetical protein